MSNRDTNGTLLEENPDMDTNDILLNAVSAETDGGEFPREDAYSRNLTLHSDSNELFVHVDNDVSTLNTSPCDIDLIAINLPTEHNNETAENFSSFEEQNVVFSEENLEKCQNVSFASDAEPSLAQLGGLNGVASQIDISTRKKLLVLDVNGLLADINSYVPYDYDPDEILCKKAVFKRPFCDDFLKFCFERFEVGVWSSRTRRNMEPIIDFLLGSDKGRLLFHWDQSHCTHTGYNTIEKRHKPLLLKKLKKLWENYEPDLPWERGVYNESNTLLIDDSPYKALCNPRYTAIFPNTYRFRDVRDNSLGPGGDLRVYLERLAMSENVQEFVKQNPFGQRPITEKNLSWRYYTRVIAAASPSPPRQTAQDACIQPVRFWS